MGPGDAAPRIIFEPWEAHPDCAHCEAREIVNAEIDQLDPADQSRARSALGYCATGMVVNPALCTRSCPIGVSRFEEAISNAVDASHQKKVRAPRLEEE